MENDQKQQDKTDTSDERKPPRIPDRAKTFDTPGVEKNK